MNAQHYLLAKYIPDFRRREPRNVGVIVCTRNRVRAKFLPVELSSFVGNTDNYLRWVRFWSKCCDEKRIRIRGKDFATLGDEDFIDRLIDSSRGNFHLERAGEVLEKMLVADVPVVLDSLYKDLVVPAGIQAIEDEESENKQPAMRLADICEDAIDQVGLNRNPHFQKRFHYACSIGDASVSLKFDYALYTHRPTHLMHRVPLGNEHSVESVAFRFNNARRAAELPIEKCAALIYFDPEDSHDPQEAERVKVMKRECRVINLAESQAEAELSDFALAA